MFDFEYDGTIFDKVMHLILRKITNYLQFQFIFSYMSKTSFVVDIVEIVYKMRIPTSISTYTGKVAEYCKYGRFSCKFGKSILKRHQ